jgi:hypothetical protein
MMYGRWPASTIPAPAHPLRMERGLAVAVHVHHGRGLVRQQRHDPLEERLLHLDAGVGRRRDGAVVAPQVALLVDVDAHFGDGQRVERIGRREVPHGRLDASFQRGHRDGASDMASLARRLEVPVQQRLAKGPEGVRVAEAAGITTVGVESSDRVEIAAGADLASGRDLQVVPRIEAVACQGLWPIGRHNNSMFFPVQAPCPGRGVRPFAPGRQTDRTARCQPRSERRRS